MLVQLDTATIIETDRVIAVEASGDGSTIKLSADGASVVTVTVADLPPKQVYSVLFGVQQPQAFRVR